MSKLAIALIVIVVAVIALTLVRGSAHRVSPEQARALVARGATLLDVRSPNEYAQGHLEGAVNIPIDVLEGRLTELGDPRAPVVLYCRSGMRSAHATRLLADAGWQQLHDLGPMTRW